MFKKHMFKKHNVQKHNVQKSFKSSVEICQDEISSWFTTDVTLSRRRAHCDVIGDLNMPTYYYVCSTKKSFFRDFLWMVQTIFENLEEMFPRSWQEVVELIKTIPPKGLNTVLEILNTHFVSCTTCVAICVARLNV